MPARQQKSLPTSQDVARIAGVSVATVSRVLSGKVAVREPARKRVLKAVKTLNYQPSRAAQRLRAQASQVIGLIISDIQNPFFTAVVRGIEDALLEHGYSLVLCNSDEDEGKERRYVDVLRAESVAGVLVASTRSINPNLGALQDHNIPVVAIDRTVTEPALDSVTVDNDAGVRMAVEHLLGLGHRRIGMVCLPEHVPTGIERKASFVRTMQAVGLMEASNWCASGSDAKASGARDAVLKLLGIQPGLTALVTASNLMSIGTLNALREFKVDTSREISLVGFDDMPWTELISPSMTAVAQPIYELGRLSASTLLQRIATPEAPIQRIRLLPALMVRESSRPPAEARSVFAPANRIMNGASKKH